MRSADAFVRLLEVLYGGLAQSPPWEDFLSALAAATDANFATLIVGRGGSGIDAHVTPGANPDRTQEYRQISEADPFVGLPEGQVVSFNDFVRHVPARFRNWMGVARTGQILGVDLHRAPDIAVRLRLTRDDSGQDFDDEEKALLGRLIPHLRIALDLYARLTTTQAESQLFSSAMADLAVATLILDRDGRIMRRNAVAARMLDEGGIIADRNGRLESRTHAVSAIERILAKPPAIGEEYVFDVPMPHGLSLQGRVRALPSPAYGDGAWLAVFLTDPIQPPAPTGESLRDRFQLTKAEAALAAQLAQGTKLVDAAGALDIAYNTARAHLRAIFSKTGTHRQVQLITLLRTGQ